MKTEEASATLAMPSAAALESRGRARVALAACVLAALAGTLALTSSDGREVPATGVPVSAAVPALAAPAPALVPRPSAATPAQADRARAALSGLPLRFERNAGQTDPRVRFLARGPGYTLFLTPREAVIKLVKPPDGNAAQTAVAGAVVRMRLAGANPAPAISGAQPLGAKSTYIAGSRRPGTVSNFRAVTYAGAYPGIDLVYHSRSGTLEYDFLVEPGADPSRIALDFRGAERMAIDGRGDLVLSTAAGPLRQKRPHVYQRVGGKRRTVSSRFTLRGRRVGFELGAYDRARTLVIDPAVTYGTYLTAATNSVNATGVAVDAAGGAYVTGTTVAVDFPTTTGAFQAARPGKAAGFEDNADRFVTKIDTNASGAASLVYSTYLGGVAETTGSGIAVDSAGAAYVTGRAHSTNFPTAGPIPGTLCGIDFSVFDIRDTVFVSKLRPDGTGLVYSTCLPGTNTFTGEAEGRAIAVDASGNAHVTGSIDSNELVTTAGARQTTPGGGFDAFLVRLNAAGSAMTYATYLGGPGDEGANAIALDGAGNAYLGGTAPTGFPTTAGARQPVFGGGSTDAFAAKLSPAGAGAADLAYSTYLGGTGTDSGAGIAVRSGEAYVAGETRSTGFPAQSALDGTLSGNSDGFVSKLNAAGSALLYSTYLGGGGDSESAGGIAVDAAGRAHVTGLARPGFPLVDPLPGTQCGPDRSAFVSRLTASGAALDYSSCLDGTASTRTAASSGRSVAIDAAGHAYVLGSAQDSDELPAVNAFQPDPTDDGAFLVRIAAAAPPRPAVEALEPRGGPTAGGTRVTIRGRNFGAASAVSFGGTPAASFTVETPTRIVAVSPARPAGRAFVAVTNGAGSSPDDTRARFAFGEGGWQRADGLNVVRARGASVTLLRDGRVLVAGGRTNFEGGPIVASVELFDPLTGQWSAGNPMGALRASHTATLLGDGRVLVAGGVGPPNAILPSAEIYDPATGQWTPTAGNMSANRADHSATLIDPAAGPCAPNCGKVLMTAGVNAGDSSSSAELFNPSTGLFEATSALGSARGRHEAVQLSGGTAVCGARCGRVLAVAGNITPTTGSSAELYNPVTGTWTPTAAQMAVRQRASVGVAMLANGRVLASGGGCTGQPAGTRSAEIYNPLTDAWATTANLMSSVRIGHGVALLPSGKALAVGGLLGCLVGRQQTAELLDPATNQWRPAGAMQDRRGSGSPRSTQAVVLSSSTTGFAADRSVCGDNCGKVLILGTSALDFADLYVPEPVVSTVSPGDGSTAGGASVTVTGQGLTHGVRQVLFGTTPAPSFTVDGYGQLRAVAPARGAGTVDVTVVNDGGRATRANAFTYSTPPPGDPPPVLDPPAVPGTDPAPGPAPGPERDAVLPVVSGVSVLDREFSIGSLLPLLARAAKVGTQVRFRLSEPATARLTFARARPGRRVGSSCRAPSARLRSRGPCIRYGTVSPAVVIRGARAGLNSVRFQGRLSRTRRLSPGRYRVTVTATDAAGNRSAPRSARFTLLRAEGRR